MRKKKWKRMAFYSCRALLRWAVIMIGTLASVSLAVYVLENQNSRMVFYIAAGLAAALYIGNLFYGKEGKHER